MLFAVEPFFLQDDRRHAVVEQREARVMSPGYDPENLHDDACGIDWVLRFSDIVLNPKRPGPLTDLSWDCLRRHAKVDLFRPESPREDAASRKAPLPFSPDGARLSFAPR